MTECGPASVHAECKPYTDLTVIVALWFSQSVKLQPFEFNMFCYREHIA